MEVTQNLENYIAKYKNENIWEMFETKHYIFRYFKNSVAEYEIEHISTTQEKAYKHITKTLEIKEDLRKIQYYIYPSEKDKEILMGYDGFAQAIWHDNSIHIVYTKDIKPIGPHEDTHLLSLPWGPSIGFFQEGLAEYMVGHAWDGKPHSHYVKEGYEKGMFPTLSEFMRHEAWLETKDEHAIYFYSLAGAFVDFLVSTYSRQKFEEFYKQTKREQFTEQNRNIFKEIYEKDISMIESEFIQNIKSQP